MTMRKLVFALFACLGLPACGPDGSCDPAVLLPATGSAAIPPGEIISGATDQRVTISADRRFLDYTFTRNGVTMTARYALAGPPPDPAP